MQLPLRILCGLALGMLVPRTSSLPTNMRGSDYLLNAGNEDPTMTSVREESIYADLQIPDSDAMGQSRMQKLESFRMKWPQIVALHMGGGSSAKAMSIRNLLFLTVLVIIMLSLLFIFVFEGNFESTEEEPGAKTYADLCALRFSEGTWARTFQEASGSRQEAIELLFRCNIVQAEEFTSSAVRIEHIEEYIAIAARMLKQKSLEEWGRNWMLALTTFQEYGACTDSPSPWVVAHSSTNLPSSDPRVNAQRISRPRETQSTAYESEPGAHIRQGDRARASPNNPYSMPSTDGSRTVPYLGRMGSTETEAPVERMASTVSTETLHPVPERMTSKVSTETLPPVPEPAPEHRPPEQSRNMSPPTATLTAMYLQSRSADKLAQPPLVDSHDAAAGGPPSDAGSKPEAEPQTVPRTAPVAHQDVAGSRGTASDSASKPHAEPRTVPRTAPLAHQVVVGARDSSGQSRLMMRCREIMAKSDQKRLPRSAPPTPPATNVGPIVGMDPMEGANADSPSDSRLQEG